MAKHLDDNPQVRPAVTETVVEANDARQGPTGRPVLMVLGASLVLVVLAWAASEYYGEQIDDAAPGVQQTETQPPAADSNTPPAVDNTTAGTTGTGQTAPVERDPTPESGTGGAAQTVTPNGTQN